MKLGMEAKLYRNTGSYAAPTWSEMTNVKDLTLNLEADVTTRGNAGWRATIAALKDGSIEFEMVWDTALVITKCQFASVSRARYPTRLPVPARQRGFSDD
jgi:hypothetical protein